MGKMGGWGARREQENGTNKTKEKNGAKRAFASGEGNKSTKGKGGKGKKQTVIRERAIRADAAIRRRRSS